MRVAHIVCIVAAMAVLEGCQRTTFSGLGSQPTTTIVQPQPLSPAPVGGVQSGQLPDATASQFPEAPNAVATDATQLAATAQDVTKEELIGRWTLTSGGASCDVFLSLTKWTGGFRAASRGCSGNTALVSAWNVEGKQVLLSDSAGANVASLYKTAEQRYDGATTVGEAINMAR